MRTPPATLLTSVNNLGAILSGDTSGHRDAGRNLGNLPGMVRGSRPTGDRALIRRELSGPARAFHRDLRFAQ